MRDRDDLDDDLIEFTLDHKDIILDRFNPTLPSCFKEVTTKKATEKDPENESENEKGGKTNKKRKKEQNAKQLKKQGTQPIVSDGASSRVQAIQAERSLMVCQCVHAGIPAEHASPTASTRPAM